MVALTMRYINKIIVAAQRFVIIIEYMGIILLFIGGPLFIIASAGYIYVRIKLKPGQDSDLDDCYWEFEDSHPQLARYNKWSQITFIAAIIGALLLFVSAIF